MIILGLAILRKDLTEHICTRRTQLTAHRTHNMDPAVIGSDQFGQLFKTILPGNYGGNLEQIYSQPLVYTLDDGIQYVFIATTQNNVYKINAKTGVIVAQRSLHIPFLTSDLAGCVDINPLVGVTVSTLHFRLIQSPS